MLLLKRNLPILILLLVIRNADAQKTWCVAPAGACSSNASTCGTSTGGSCETSYANHQACCVIQDAINRTNNGDTVLVKPGTYEEQLIRFLEKGITVKKDVSFPGEAIVRHFGNNAAVVQINCGSGHCGSDHGTLGGIAGGAMEGFTITGNGNGISVVSAHPTIRGNKIVGCNGSGVYLENTSALLERVMHFVDIVV